MKSIEEIKDIVSKEAKKYPEIDKVYLFGSYARSEAKEDSDVDLMIKGNLVNNYIRFLVDLEQNLDMEVQIVDEEQIKKSEFLISKYLLENYYIERILLYEKK